MKLTNHIKLVFLNKIKIKVIFDLTIIIFLFLSINGCGLSKVSIKKDDLAANQTVKITKNISMTEEIFFRGKKENIIIGLSPLIGTAIAGKSGQTTASILKNTMDKANINLTKMVREEVERQLKTSNLFSTILTDENHSYPEIKLAITKYGFTQDITFKGSLESGLKTVLVVKGLFVKPDGTVIWESSDYVGAVGDTPAYTLEEYLTNPELIQEGFNSASKIVVRMLIDQMAGL